MNRKEIEMKLVANASHPMKKHVSEIVSNLVSLDICGVQPIKKNGMAFFMTPHYPAEDDTNPDKLFPEMALAMHSVPVVPFKRTFPFRCVRIDEASYLASLEIDKEIFSIVERAAIKGAGGTGVYKMDGDWTALDSQIERECNSIAKTTKRGKGNLVVVSPNVALGMQKADRIVPGKRKDDDNPCFIGHRRAAGQRVYVDPKAEEDFVTVGYVGTNKVDAGLFYCPEDIIQKSLFIDNEYASYITSYAIVENGPEKNEMTSYRYGKPWAGEGRNAYYRHFKLA